MPKQHSVVEGILNSRDFTIALMAGENNWHRLLRKAVRLQQNITLLQALKALRGRRNQLAVVYSGAEILGIVTMQNIFDQIIGDIYDENDESAMKLILGSSHSFERASQISRSAPF